MKNNIIEENNEKYTVVTLSDKREKKSDTQRVVM